MPKDIVKFLQRHKRYIDHISGSHAVMRSHDDTCMTIVPQHKKDLPIGTLMAILRQTGYTKNDLDT